MTTSRFCIVLKRSLHLGRVVPELDSTIREEIIENKLNPKRLVTRRNMGLVRLPAKLEYAALNTIKQSSDKKFRKEFAQLIAVMRKIKLPDETETLKIKRADIKTNLEVRDKIKNRTALDPGGDWLAEENFLARQELSDSITGALQNQRRDWHYYEYDEYASNLYMACRLAPNYACLRTVLSEIRDFDPSFKPESTLDFGSGMGTTIWAVNDIWPDFKKDFMNVDLSNSQKQLCENLLRGGTEFGRSLTNVSHRQYLPSSDKVKYDLVVAAFSLLELPNLKLRTQIIENLWNKTNDILVLVERGNKGGFTCVNDARNLILNISGFKVTNRVDISIESHLRCNQSIPDAHIVAPCSHEFYCPKAVMPNKNNLDVCRFSVVFEPLEIGMRKSGFIHEEFSYLIIRKGPHPSYFNRDCGRWPRIVEKRNHSHSQITQTLCCPNGHLAEIVFTKKRYGKAEYEIAKSCNWGDSIPIKIRDEYKSRSSINTIDNKTLS